MDWRQLRETVLDPEKRTLLRITVEDAEEATEVFDMLMGSNVKLRREFIENNADTVELNYV